MGRPSSGDAAVDLTKVMKKRSVQVEIQAVVGVQVTTGGSERSVGLDGDRRGPRGAARRAGRGKGCSPRLP